MATLEQFVTEIESLLRETTAGNTARIMSATSTLNTKYYTKPQCLPALIHIATSCPEGQLRQFAAVEARKRTRKLWSELDVNMKNGLKQKTLDSIVVEPENRTRNALADLIAAIATIEIPQGTWPTLLPFLYQCCNSTTCKHREIGILVLYTLFEIISDYMAEHIPDMFVLFSKTINDAESLATRVVTLRALGKIAEYIDPDGSEVKMFRDLIPSMVAVLQACLDANDYDNAQKGIEVFDSFLILETPILARHIPELLSFFVQVAKNANYESSSRSLALNFLASTAEFHKSKIQKHKLTKPLIEAVLPIGAEEEEDEDEDEASPARDAYHVIGAVARSLPPQQVIPAVMEQVVRYSQDANPRLRRCGVMAFAMIIDGTAEALKEMSAQCIEIVTMALKDQDVGVRRAGCMALAILADFWDAELMQHHATLLPLLFENLDSPNSDLQKESTTALDSLLENLAAEEITPYLHSLLTKLIWLLDNGQASLKAMVVAAIGSAAHAAGEGFNVYFVEVMRRLVACIKDESKDPDVMLLRAVATDTVGTVVESVGSEMGRPYLNDIMQLAFHGLALDNARLRECTFILFGVLSRVFGTDFAPFLQNVVPLLVSSLNQEEPMMEQGVVDLTAAATADDEEDFRGGFVASNAVVEEKEMAIQSLGEIFTSTKTHFLPFFEPSLNALLECTTHYHEDIRKGSVEVLCKFLMAFYEISNPAAWTPGLPVANVDGNVAKCLDVVMSALVKCLGDEDHRYVVTELFNSLAEVLKSLGPLAISDTTFSRTLLEHAHQVMSKTHAVQTDVDEYQEEEEEEIAQNESLLISAAAEFISAVAQVLGPQFVESYQHFHGLLVKYYSSKLPVSDRTMAIGCLGEIAAGLSSGVDKFKEDMLRTFGKALKDEDEEVRSNAAFGIGMVVQGSTTDSSAYYPTLLPLLAPLFSESVEMNIRDNACGCISRMVMKHPQAVPLDQVLPVMLEALPLRYDFEENEAVYKCLVGLLRSGNTYLLHNLDRMMAIFAQVLSPPETQLKDKTRHEVVSVLSELKMQNSAGFQQMISGLGGEIQGVFGRILN